jgi:hypothetical protein
LYKNAPSGEDFSTYLHDALLQSYMENSIDQKFEKLGMTRTAVDIFMRNVIWESEDHDYYSIWFIFNTNFFISEEIVWVIKLNSHLVILRNVYNFYKISNILNIFFFKKKWEIKLLYYFYEYAILLHPNFSFLTVDQGSPLSMKRSGGRVGGWSTISDKWGNHLPCQPTIAAQLLGNGGKIEPYTITIMPRIFWNWLFGNYSRIYILEISILLY